MPGAVERDECLLHDVLRPRRIADPASDERMDEPRHPRQQIFVGLPIAILSRGHQAPELALLVWGHRTVIVEIYEAKRGPGYVPRRA